MQPHNGHMSAEVSSRPAWWVNQDESSIITLSWTLGSASPIGQPWYAADLDPKSGPKLRRRSSVGWNCSVSYAVDLGYLGKIAQFGTMSRAAGSTQLCVSDEDYVAIDAFCGVGCFASRHTWTDRPSLRFSLSINSRLGETSSNAIVANEFNEDIFEMLSQYLGHTRLAILSRIVDERERVKRVFNRVSARGSLASKPIQIIPTRNPASPG